ncbi:hypothetical protein E3N88_15326 [Mikania micrantha]|uniref:Uncharacterized protein n=1 Tax=Mikania micrantha TaxID=192012 RepID=A0A5N6NXX0_9ASTR|nr:hypothetical protein E3N88_15326 [Mikania micrantha]
MPLEDYAAQLSVQEQGLRKYITELCIAKTGRGYSGFSPFPLLNFSFMVSTGVALPIHCEYPCQPFSPPPPAVEPVYGAPPPPGPPPSSGPVYDSPTQPTKPSCVPPPPTKPSCEPPPLAPPVLPGPVYGPPPSPILPGNCQPSLQNCGYPPPITNVYQPVNSASHLPLDCLLVLILMFFSFLHF